MTIWCDVFALALCELITSLHWHRLLPTHKRYATCNTQNTHTLDDLNGLRNRGAKRRRASAAEFGGLQYRPGGRVCGCEWVLDLERDKDTTIRGSPPRHYSCTADARIMVRRPSNLLAMPILAHAPSRHRHRRLRPHPSQPSVLQ